MAFQTGFQKNLRFLYFGKELSEIRAGKEVAVHCLNLQMQSVLVRGTFKGIKRQRLFKVGTVDIEWVYNSMPPIHEQIYPEIKLEPVTEF